MSQIEYYRGDSYPTDITIINKKTKQPVNIDGYTFKMTVSTVKAPPDESSKKFEVIGSFTTPATGVVSFLPTTANNADVGSFFYDIVMTNPA